MRTLITLVFCSTLFLIRLCPLQAQSYQPTNLVIEGNPADQDETMIAVDPNNPQHLLAAWNDWSESNPPSAISNPGFGFSTDGGNSWATGLVSEHLLHADRS